MQEIMQMKDTIYMNSVAVANMIGKRHNNLIRTIDGYTDSILADSKLSTLNSTDSKLKISDFFVKDIYYDKQRKQRRCYLLTKQGCEMVANKMTGDKGVLFTALYVKKFNEMEKQLQQKAIARAVSKEIRKTLTDVIKAEVPESPHKRFIYKNYTDLVYKSIFGLNAKKLREKLSIPKSSALRDYLTVSEIKQVEKIERLVQSLLEIGWEYEMIKGFLAGQKLKIA